MVEEKMAQKEMFPNTVFVNNDSGKLYGNEKHRKIKIFWL